LAGESVTDAQALVPAKQATIAGTRHTLILLVALIAWAFWSVIRADRMSAMVHPNRMAVYLLTIVWQWGVVAYIVFGVRRHGGSLRDIVGGRWNGMKDFLWDWGIAVVFWFAAVTAMILVAFALHAGYSNQGTRFLKPEGTTEVILWIFVSLTTGICEEIMFRGYFQRQLIAWTGSVPTGILLSASIFGAMHLYRGGRWAIVLGVFGLLFGILAQKRRSLRPGMMTHAWHDVFVGLIGKLIRT
jgi:membrane protease YdiL (CAAX protease family)